MTQKSLFNRIWPFIKARYAPRGARSTFSASGEDVVISDLLKKIQIRNPFYIDIGAHHPIFGNNTYLLYKKGGQGILVEPNKELVELAEKKRPRDISINAGAGKEDSESDFYSFSRSTRSTFSKDQADDWEKVSGEKAHIDKRRILSLDTIISLYAGGRIPDVVSIDAEGLDIEILKGFSFEKRPKVFCIELAEGIIPLMEEKGYELEARIFQNGIFSDKNILKK